MPHVVPAERGFISRGAQYKQNHLLAALPKAEFARLGPKIKIVTLPLGKALYEPGTMLRHVYFPTDSIVSLLYVMSDGASAEIALVGNEGVVGVALFMGGETTPSRAVVQSAGEGYQLEGELLKREFNRGGAMRHLLLRYTQAVQSASFTRSAIVPLVTAEPRSSTQQRADHDPGTDRQHARCASRRCHRGRRQAATGWFDSI